MRVQHGSIQQKEGCSQRLLWAGCIKARFVCPDPGPSAGRQHAPVRWAGRCRAPTPPTPRRSAWVPCCPWATPPRARLACTRPADCVAKTLRDARVAQQREMGPPPWAQVLDAVSQRWRAAGGGELGWRWGPSCPAQRAFLRLALDCRHTERPRDGGKPQGGAVLRGAWAGCLQPYVEAPRSTG